MITLKRIIKFGAKNFSRNVGINLASIFVVFAAVFLGAAIYIFNIGSAAIISSLQEKMDVSVYFKKDTDPAEIMKAKDELLKISDVKAVEYTSKETALDVFKELHKDDPVLLESLVEVGDNPFLSSLSIKANDASKYQPIADYLESSEFSEWIDNIDYHQRKPVIDKVFSITSAANRAGVVIAIVFAVFAFLIAFNTVKIAIGNSSEEISVMRLVGSSAWFAKGPFLIQGIFIGKIAAILSILAVAGSCYELSPKLLTLAPGVNLWSVFLSNFWYLLLIQCGIGLFFGIFPSSAAVRKYLKI